MLKYYFQVAQIKDILEYFANSSISLASFQIMLNNYYMHNPIAAELSLF